VRNYLLNEYNLEIGAGLGKFAGKAWRIGLMGYAARSENVALCLAALKDALSK
jgi:alanine-glyoxylate transaminase/serine-glyoxylate transaminase/serine-pyruvate transaminase